MSVRQNLLDYGFQEVKKNQSYRLLELRIDEIGDRYPTVLHWYSDTPKKIHLIVYKVTGAVEIEESYLLENHNELYYGALRKWKKFEESFPEIKSFI